MKWNQRITIARERKGLSKSDFWRLLKVSSATATNWENGKVLSIKGENLVNVCRVLGVSENWLLNGIEDNETAIKNPLIHAFHPEDELSEDTVLIPESKISFAAGNGRIASYELLEDQEPASYRLSWFQKYGINPEKVRRFRVSGDSMEPMLYHRDTILVNTEETNIIDNKLYAIRYGDDLRVKYLIKKLDGTIVMRRVNPLYKDEEIPPQLASEHISIIGRVRDKSGTGGL